MGLNSHLIRRLSALGVNFISLLVLCVPIAQAQVKNVAVLPTSDSESGVVDPRDLKLMSEAIQEGLREALPSGYNVYDGPTINALLQNQTMAQCMENAKCENDVFKNIQVSFGISFRVIRVGVGLEIKVTARNVDNGGQHLGSATVIGREIREIRDKLKRESRTTIVQAVTGGVGGSAVHCNVTFITDPPGGGVSVNGIRVCPENQPKRCRKVLVPAGKPRITITMFNYWS